MPPPITSRRPGRSGSSSAPVESMMRGSSGRTGSAIGSEPAAMMHCSKRNALRLARRCVTSMTCGLRNWPVPRSTSTLRCLASPASPPVELRHDLVLPVAQLGEIELRRAELDAVRGHRARLIDDLGRVQQRLGRNAADVQAHAAERRPAIDQRDLQARDRRRETRPYSRRGRRRARAAAYCASARVPARARSAGAGAARLRGGSLGIGAVGRSRLGSSIALAGRSGRASPHAAALDARQHAYPARPCSPVRDQRPRRRARRPWRAHPSSPSRSRA